MWTGCRARRGPHRNTARSAQLRVKLTDGRVVEADLDTPSDVNIALVETVTAQQELGDALAAVASLDLSPWEVRG